MTRPSLIPKRCVMVAVGQLALTGGPFQIEKRTPNVRTRQAQSDRGLPRQVGYQPHQAIDQQHVKSPHHIIRQRFPGRAMETPDENSG